MADPKGNLVTPVAHRSDGSIHALELDDSDRLKVLVDAITGNVTVVYPENSLNNPVGSVMQGGDTTLAAGTNLMEIYTVPASQRIQLDVIAYRYVGTITNVIIAFSIIRNSVVSYLDRRTPIINSFVYIAYPQIILEAGDIIRCEAYFATLNDQMIADIFFRRIK